MDEHYKQEREVGTYHALAVFHVDLVAKDHEGEIIGILGCSLYEELVPPGIDRIE